MDNKLNENIVIGLESMRIDFNANDNCGGVAFQWDCPDCGEPITWAPRMYWKAECCRVWDFKIIGTQNKEQQ